VSQGHSYFFTKVLKDQVDKLEKEMEMREIPKISPQTDFDLYGLIYFNFQEG